jgi:hypothetical protein
MPLTTLHLYSMSWIALVSSFTENLSHFSYGKYSTSCNIIMMSKCDNTVISEEWATRPEPITTLKSLQQIDLDKNKPWTHTNHKTDSIYHWKTSCNLKSYSHFCLTG